MPSLYYTICSLLNAIFCLTECHCLPPGQALRSAQLWLRDATRQELGETYKSLTRMSPHEAYRELVLTGDPGDKPYANPYFWAPFTFTGV